MPPPAATWLGGFFLGRTLQWSAPGVASLAQSDVRPRQDMASL
ncbi:MAG TPA: hypothetical protein VGC28_09155 [Sphingomonas sp.]